jgi:PIN domain nuclease of toxin-antitoxin system
MASALSVAKSTAPLLDTHVWLWWLLGQPDLPAAQRSALDAMAAAGRRPALCAISLWEAQMLVAKRRLAVDTPLAAWLPIAAEAVDVLPIDVKVVLAVDALPNAFHGDPADRIIVATARAHGLALATHDAAIRRARLVNLWRA